jgi:hypothetical protein
MVIFEGKARDLEGKIERCLVRLGGSGTGMRSRATSIRSVLGEELLARIGEVAPIRNGLAHGQKFGGDQVKYLQDLEAIVHDLTQLAGDDDTLMEEHSSYKTEWLEKQVEFSRVLGGYDSTGQSRLVFFRENGDVDVKPPGHHRVPLFGVKAIGWVNMQVARMEVDVKDDAPTRDNLKVDVKLTLWIQVRDENASIVRVALNALEEQARVRERAIVTLREVIGDVEAAGSGIRANAVADRVFSRLAEELLADDSAFSLRSSGGVSLRQLELTDEGLRGHSAVLMGIAQKTEQSRRLRDQILVDSENQQIPLVAAAKARFDIDRNDARLKVAITEAYARIAARNPASEHVVLQMLEKEMAEAGYRSGLELTETLKAMLKNVYGFRDL